MTKPLQLLILEDNPSDMELMLTHLRAAGFGPDWKQIDNEADYLAALDPALDLILADYYMPQFDALRALQLLQERDLDIPFIVVTGSQGEEAAVECMKEGASDYLLKDRLTRLGPAIHRALELARLRTKRRQAEEEFKRMAIHDPLTGLYNRVYFGEEMARLEHGRVFPVSVVMADLDGLKRVNDTYGHAAGDELLRCAVKALCSAFRAEDAIARIGGDEFAVLLPGTSEQVAQAVVQRLRNQLSAGNPVGNGSYLSLSLGVATAERGQSLADALQRADDQMYRHKSARASAVPKTN